MSHRRQSFSCILSLPLMLSKGPCHARETDENRPQLSPALTAPRLRALHRAEDIGSALKGGVNVCQRQLANEVLGSLVTEFVRNFRREDATPCQRAPMPPFSVASRPSNSSDIDALIVSQSTNQPIGCPKNAGHCPKNAPIFRNRAV